MANDIKRYTKKKHERKVATKTKQSKIPMILSYKQGTSPHVVQKKNRQKEVLYLLS